MKKLVLILSLLSFACVNLFGQTSNTQLPKTFGSIDYKNINLVHQTEDGDFIIMDDAKSFGVGNYYLWSFKINTNGDTLWKKTFIESDSDHAFSLSKTIGVQNGWIPQISGISSSLNSLYFIDDNTGWATGYDGTIIHTEDGGLNWQQQDSDTTDELRDVFFLDPNQGWLVGGKGLILMTGNGGYTWEYQTSPVETFFHAINFIDENHGWIAGGHYKVSGPIYNPTFTAYGYVMRSDDGGNSWYRSSSVNRYVLDIYFVDELNGWLVSEYTDNSDYQSYAGIYHSSNGGNSWTYQTIPIDTSILKSITFVDENVGWAVGENGLILNTIDGGTNWNVQNSGTSENLYSIFFINNNTGWIVGGRGIILKTTDGGANWIPQNSGTSSWLYSVFFVDTNIGWSVGSGGTILKTGDNNPPYIISPSVATAYENSLFEYTARAIDPEDSVITYTFEEYPYWLTPADSTIYGIPPEGVQDTSFVIIASDGDLSDTLLVAVTVIPVNDPPNTFKLLSPVNGSVIDTLNPNLIWQQSIDPDKGDTIKYKLIYGKDISFVIFDNKVILSDTFYIICGGLAPSTTYFWTVTAFDTSDASTASLDTFKLVTSETATFLENRVLIDIPKYFDLSQNYPNPFNAKTIIKYQLAKSSDVKLSIYDIVSRLIISFIYENQPPGYYSIIWDGKDKNGRNIASGVYFYNLRTEDFTKTNKMVLIQ